MLTPNENHTGWTFHPWSFVRHYAQHAYDYLVHGIQPKRTEQLRKRAAALGGLIWLYFDPPDLTLHTPQDDEMQALERHVMCVTFGRCETNPDNRSDRVNLPNGKSPFHKRGSFTWIPNK